MLSAAEIERERERAKGVFPVSTPKKRKKELKKE
jgi:hypothetical protein